MSALDPTSKPKKMIARAKNISNELELLSAIVITYKHSIHLKFLSQTKLYNNIITKLIKLKPFYYEIQFWAL